MIQLGEACCGPMEAAEQNREPRMWANWEDYGPLCVEAAGLTLEQARLIVVKAYPSDFYGPAIVLPFDNDQPRWIEVWECDYDSPVLPCPNPECPHKHSVLAYVFELADPEDSAGMCDGDG